MQNYRHILNFNLQFKSVNTSLQVSAISTNFKPGPSKKGGNGSEGQGKETIKWNGGRIGFGSERWESRREAQTERGSKNSKWKRIEEMVGGETCNNFDPPVLKTWRRACCPKEMLLLRRVSQPLIPYTSFQNSNSSSQINCLRYLCTVPKWWPKTITNGQLR